MENELNIANSGDEYRMRMILELEQDLLKATTGNSTVREADFRRQGLALLSGLLDDTFNDKAWAEYVGSYHVGLDIYSTDEKTVLFTIPPLLRTGVSLVNVPGQQTLTEEASETYRTVGAGPLADEAIGQLVINTVLNMNQLTAEEDRKQALDNIVNLNRIFEYYGVRGRIEIPKEAQVAAPAATTIQPVTQPRYDYDQGEDL